MKRFVVLTLVATCIVIAIGATGTVLTPHRQSLAQWSPPEAVMLTRITGGRPKFVIRGPQSSSSQPSAPQIARTASIRLYVKDVERAVESVNQVARAETGDVLSLDDHRVTEKGYRASAQIDVRVPDSRFSETLSRLATVGAVRTQSIAAEDLTSQIVDSSARLRNLRRTESDMLKIMDRSGSFAQVMDAENRLSQVREQIETLDSQTKSMLNRVHYSTIEISMDAEVAPAPSEPAGLAQLSSAWIASFSALGQLTIGLIAALIWILAFTPYALAVALVAWLVRRKLKFARN